MKKHNSLENSRIPNRIEESHTGMLFDNRIEIEQPVDVVEIATFLKKKPNTIRNWISTGRYNIPHIRLGNKSMFFTSSVSNWLKQQQENMK